MPKRLSQREWKEFLKGRHVAVLATIAPDGQPILTPIWYTFEGGKILMRTGTDSIKASNVRREPRVTVCVQNEAPPYKSVTVFGKAVVEPERPGLGARTAKRYLGAVAGAAYMRTAAQDIQQSGEVTLVITIDKVWSQDFSEDVPTVGKVWMTVKKVLPPAI